MKKLVCSICIAFLLLISFHANVEAKTPNVKDCIENIEDCSDTAEINVDDNEGESDLTSTDKKNKPLVFDLIKMVLALLLVLGLKIGRASCRERCRDRWSAEHDKRKV